MIGVNRKTMWRWSRDGVFLSTVYHPNGRRAGVWLPMFLSEYPWIENDKPPQNI